MAHKQLKSEEEVLYGQLTRLEEFNSELVPNWGVILLFRRTESEIRRVLRSVYNSFIPQNLHKAIVSIWRLTSSLRWRAMPSAAMTWRLVHREGDTGGKVTYIVLYYVQ
mgnify:CR=1 FL=1